MALKRSWLHHLVHLGSTTVLAVLLSLVVALPGAFAQAQGTISGTIGFSSGGTAPTSVSVNIFQANDTWLMMPVYQGSTNTSLSWQYSAVNLPAGDYKVLFYPDDGSYLSEWWQDKTSQGTATTVTVGAGSTTTVSPLLDPGGTVTGTIDFTAGATLPTSVSVNFYRADTGAYACGVGTSAYQGWHYSTGGLPAGDYEVQFYPAYDGYYQTEWWQDQASQGGATHVTVSVGNATTVNPTLNPGGIISGTVDFAAGGATPTTLSVNVYRADTGASAYSGTMYSMMGWQYSTGVLPAGDYKVHFSPADGSYASEWWQDQASQGSATPVTVSLGNTTAVSPTLNLSPGGIISGTIDFAAGGALPTSVSVNVYRADTGDSFYSGSTTAAASWQYSVGGVPAADYKVQFTPNGGWYAAEWWQDQTYQSTASPVAVSLGNTTTVSPTLDPGGTISGTIGFAAGGTVPPDISVTVYRADTGAHVLSANANWMNNYHYSTGVMPPGDYTVQFSTMPGSNGSYAPEWWQDQSSQGTATPVTVGVGTTTAVDPTLDLGGKISGTVTAGGVAAANVQVAVYAPSIYGYSTVGFGWTNSSGVYTVSGLATGTYKVEFAMGNSAYISQWYDNASSYAAATPVDVLAGSTTTGIDAALAVGGSISGTVTAAGVGVPNIYVNVVAPSIYGYSPVGYAFTDAMGVYTAGGLATGTYKVQFAGGSSTYVSEWYDNAAYYADGTPVAVTAGSTTTGIDASLNVGATISGVVHAPGMRAGDTIYIMAQGASVSPANCSSRPYLGMATVSADGGSYTITGLPTGQVFLYFTNDSYNDFASQWWDGAYTCATATAVDVVAGTNYTGIDFTLKAPVSVSGTVRDSSGQPVGGVWVAAKYDACALPSDWNSWARSAWSAADGTYTITGVPPTTLSFAAQFDGQYKTEYWDGAAGTGTKNCGSAVAFDLGSGPAPAVDFSLDPWPQPPQAVSADDTAGGMVLVWEESPSAGLSGYKVYRSVASTGVFTQIGTTAALTYTDKNVFRGERYNYFVTAYDSDSESYYSEWNLDVTVGAPRPPATLAGTSGGGLVDLSWAANQEMEIGRYNVYRKTAAASGFTTISNDPYRPYGAVPVGSPTAVSFHDEPLDPTQVYCYSVTAVGAGTWRFESNASQEIILAANGLQPPAGLIATPGTGQVALDWSDVGPPLDHYVIYRTVKGAAAYTMLTPPTPISQSSYIDTTVIDGTRYQYLVGAMDAAGGLSVNLSSWVSATPGGPAVPTGLAASLSGGAVVLDWADNSPAVNGYKVYRSVSGGSSYTRIGTAAGSTYTDTLADVYNSYIYRVSAEAGGVESGLSEPAPYITPNGQVEFRVALVFSENLEYDPSLFPLAQVPPFVNGVPFWHMIASAEVAGTPATPVMLDSVPTGQYALNYWGAWGLYDRFSVGQFNDFVHPTYGGPFAAPGAAWQDKTYSFTIGTKQSDWYIPNGSLRQMPLVQNIMITGGKKPVITWDPVTGADSYTVWIFGLNPNGNPGPLRFMSTGFAAPSYTYDGDIFAAGGEYAIRINANEFHPYSGDPLYPGYANKLLNRSSFYTRYDVPNDPPTLSAIANVMVNEDAGPQNVPLYLISAGPGESQALIVTASSSNTGLIPDPVVMYTSPDPTGSLSFTPVANANGTATITVTVNDGQPANNTVAQTFQVNVTAVNDAPSFVKGADQTVSRNPGAQTVANWATGISAGPADESGQTLTFLVTNDNNTLFSVQPAVAANGTLSYTPAHASGTATVTVRLKDNGGTANGGVDTSAPQSFTITVNPCTFLLAPSVVTLAANADLGAITVTTQPGCTWSATKSDLWMTITAGSSGNGSGTVQFSVPANKTASPRSGSITVAGTSVTITQTAQPLTASFVGIVNGRVYERPYGPAPLTVTFDASGSAGPNPITGYHWEFGDGQTADVATDTIVHSYTQTGSYFVTLTVTDSQSATDSTQRIVSAAEVVQTVSNATELRTALSVAQANNKHDIIRLAGGVYQLLGNGDAPFTYTSTESKDLIIEGGWAPDFSQRAYNIPTELRNDSPTAWPGDGGALRIAAGGGVTVDGVTISHGITTGNAGGLYVRTAGSIVVGNSRVSDCATSGEGGGLFLESTGSGVWLYGSAITGNSGATGGGGVVKGLSAYVYTNEVSNNTGYAADGGLLATAQAGGELIVSNNTIYGNHTIAGGSGLTVGATGTGGIGFLDIHNNIVYGNDNGIPETAADVSVTPGCGYLRDYLDLNIVNNSIYSYAMCADYLLDSSNVGVDFGGRATGDIRLAATDTALIDHGTDYSVPPEDFEGDAVPLDGDGDTSAVPDIGADEYNPANVAGPTAIGVAPATPLIGSVSGSATLTVSLDQAAKRDVVVYLTHADTNTDSPGQPLVTLTPQYLKILKGATSAQATVQALGAARHGTALIGASDPSGLLTSGAATVTIDINLPAAVTLVAPSDVIVTATPTYTWNALAGADSYQLWVGSGPTTAISVWYTASDAGCASGTGTCSVTPATALAAGKWSFNVKARNVVGTGPWTTAQIFTYTVPFMPTAITLVSPTGVVGTATPTYTWTAMPTVASYQLWVGMGATTVISQWYTAAQAGCGSGTGTCSVTPATALAQGKWAFNVKGQNIVGTGPWTVAKNFTYTTATTPTALTLVSPAGVIPMVAPTYTWIAMANVDTYLLYVGDGKSSTPIYQWYTAAAAGCASGQPTCSVTPATALTEGVWYFNVKGQNLAGTSPWATSKMFIYTNATLPTTLTLQSPSGAIGTNTPTYTWDALAGVDSYLLYVGGATTAVYQWYTAAAAGCASGEPTCSVTPSTVLATGTWYFNVRGKNLAGTGPWAVSKKFIIP